MQSQVQRSSVFSLYSIIPSGYQSFQIFLTSFHLLVPLRIVPPDSATAYRTQRKKKCRFLSHVGTPTHHAGLMNGWFGGTHLGNLHIKMYKHVKLWIDEEKSLGFPQQKKARLPDASADLSNEHRNSWGYGWVREKMSKIFRMMGTKLDTPPTRVPVCNDPWLIHVRLHR